MNISQQLRKYRTEKGFTQEQLANKVGVTVKTVYRWEAGEGSPRLDQFFKLQEVLGVNGDQLQRESA